MPTLVKKLICAVFIVVTCSGVNFSKVFNKTKNEKNVL
jgi:hypothetical protein